MARPAGRVSWKNQIYLTNFLLLMLLWIIRTFHWIFKLNAQILFSSILHLGYSGWLLEKTYSSLRPKAPKNVLPSNISSAQPRGNNLISKARVRILMGSVDALMGSERCLSSVSFSLWYISYSQWKPAVIVKIVSNIDSPSLVMTL